MVHRAVDLVLTEARGSCPCAVACGTFCVTWNGQVYVNCTEVVPA